MNLRVTVTGEAKGQETRSRSESEFEQGVKSVGVDAKPSDLPLARLKACHPVMGGERGELKHLSTHRRRK